MANLYEIQTVWSGVEGAPFYTTLRGLSSGTTTPQEMADAWETFLEGLQAVTDNALVAVVNDEVRVIESTTGETQSVSTISGATVAMAHTGDPLPPLCQMLLRWSTGVFTGGRRIRGRTFIPGGMEAYNTAAGKVDAGLASGLQTNAEAFITACSGDFVIYSPTHRAYASVQEAQLSTDWSFLRSRRD